jgi:tetratricopeptide (TPR) repeat protein
LYQQGRFQWEKRDGASLLRAAEYFRQAIARDSMYAEAYAGLADALNIHHELFAPEVREEGVAAIAAARRAVELDPTLAEAHAGLGFTLFCGEWDWAGADSAFRRSIALDPDYAPAYYWYAQLFAFRDNIDSAVVVARRATELDRLSTIAHLVLGAMLLHTERRAEAVAELQLATELQPASYLPWQMLTLAYLRAGQPVQARSAAVQFLSTLMPGKATDSTLVDDVITMLSGRGEPAKASRFLGRIGADSNNASAAYWFTMAGLADSAFARTTIAIERRNAFVAAYFYWFRTMLRGDPRVDELLRRMKAKAAER